MNRSAVVFLLNSFALGGSERKVVKLTTRLFADGTQVGCAYMQRPDTLESTLPVEVPRWFLDRRARLSLGVIARLKRLLRQNDRTTLVAVNQYPAIYVAVMALLAPQRLAKTVCLMNTATFERRRDFWFQPLYRWSLRRIDVVVYGSEKQRALWDSPGSASWPRSCVLYNGVDLQRFDADAAVPQAAALREKCSIPHSRFVFGSIGRLASEKNYPVLVTALAQLTQCGIDAQLLLAGEGPLRARLEEMGAALGVADRVSLIGEMADVRPALAAMDVFVLPSTNETFSNAALEAMAMSRPVILSDVGGASEMIVDGQEGRLVPLATLEADLLRCLQSLAIDSAGRCAMGKAARVRVASQFSDAAMLVKYRELLDL